LENFDLTYLTVDSVQEGVGASQVTPLLIGLAKMGRKICLITFEKTKPNTQLQNSYSDAGVTWIAKEFGKNGPIGGLSRFMEIRKSVPSSRALHGRSDLATGAGLLSDVGSPMLWDVRSLWSDQRLQIGSQGWNKATGRGARSLENFSASKSHAMVTLTAAIIPVLEKRHPRLPQIRDVIPTCVGTDKFTPSAMPDSTLTCLLSGTFNNFYDLDRTKQIIAAIRESTKLKVVWARSAESPRTTLGVGEDSVIEASSSEMPPIVANSHFGIAILKNDSADSLAAAVPTKIGEFLSSGRPVIVSKGIGDLDEILTKNSSGIVVDSDDPLKNLSQEIRSLVWDRATPDNCRELAMQHFDMNKAILRYDNIYQQMSL
jgi:hypothetical protein